MPHNTYHKKAGMGTLISDKVKFRVRNIVRANHHTQLIMIKGSFYHIKIINIYASNKRATKYIKTKLKKLSGEIEKSTYSCRLQYSSLSG